MKQLVFGIIILATLGIIGFTILSMSNDNTSSRNTSDTDTASQTEPQNTQPANEDELSEFTKEDVAAHNSKDDCWTIIDGNVYDLTSYISGHPGGDEILRACGTDATTLFNSRTTDEGEQVGSGTPHSSSAATQLANLQIGVLTQ